MAIFQRNFRFSRTRWWIFQLDAFFLNVYSGVFWIIVTLICYWVSKTLFWILLAIVGFVCLFFIAARLYGIRCNRGRESNKEREERILQERERRTLREQEEERNKQKLITKKRKLITSEIDKHLQRALRIMDNTAKYYNNENEANRELVSVLNAQGIEAKYLYRLSNGRIADAEVGNVLIEGKLSPDTREVDQLIGQIGDYAQHSSDYKINIVCYGELTEIGRERIEEEVLQRYAGKVFLSYLENPQRLRRLEEGMKC